MRSRTANWFLCKIRYDKVMDDGLQKKVVEQYVVEALSFADAEARITEEMSQYISGEFEVAEIDRCAFREVFLSDDPAADKWYKSKLQFITIDERSAKEKKTSVYYLVEGCSLENARSNIDQVMGATMIDYTISAVSETAIMDVFECI
jgi:hypothetical protein